MGLFKQLRSWRVRLPSSLGQANIHVSLLLTLFLISFATFVLSVTQPSLADLRPFVLTLPCIWVISLAVRTASQHAAIGPHSLELETVLGPTGNLSTDYEDLPPSRILRYAVAGHMATLFLAVLGGLICAALLPVDSALSWAVFWDVEGGWSNRALATQIMWVNIIIGVLNLLPTIPFDNRALLYSLLCRKQLAEEPAILHRLALLDSHVAALLLGGGSMMLLLGWFSEIEYFGWYGLIAAAIYLFVASRWESARSRQLEEQYMPYVTVRRDMPQRKPPAPHFSQAPKQPRQATAANSAPKLPVTDADLDEILRKLHREGTAALSIQEQEALLTASQKLKEKRAPRRS
jgi:hypothetical protein